MCTACIPANPCLWLTFKPVPRLPCPPGEDGKLEAVVRDTARVASEQIKGLSTQVGGCGWAGVGRPCCCSGPPNHAGLPGRPNQEPVHSDGWF